MQTADNFLKQIQAKNQSSLGNTGELSSSNNTSADEVLRAIQAQNQNSNVDTSTPYTNKNNFSLLAGALGLGYASALNTSAFGELGGYVADLGSLWDEKEELSYKDIENLISIGWSPERIAREFPTKYKPSLLHQFGNDWVRAGVRVQNKLDDAIKNYFKQS